MITVFINGYTFHFDPTNKRIYEPDDHSQYTTWNHLTSNEREQIRNQLELQSKAKYYQEKLAQS